MRTTYVMRNGELVEKHKANDNIDAPMIMGDITPYQSMIDGSMIQSRSRHREHLKNNGCIEVGNESMETKLTAPSNEKRREVLAQQLGNMTHNEANKIMNSLREQANQMKYHRR
jgi:hypothetical protein